MEVSLIRHWLIQFRKYKGLTQSQVASSAFIDRGYYSQIETGKRNPGLNIAINIAKVLGFDSLMFYQEHLNQTSNEKGPGYQIAEYFRSMESGEILYLYNNAEDHLQHLISFLVSGAGKKSDCLIIDYQKNHNSLQEILNESEILESVHFIDKEKSDLGIFDKIHIFLSSRTETIRIWLAEDPHEHNDWFSELEFYLNERDMTLTKNKIFFVRSYNASLITAGIHIKMMRNYPYLMTDKEIVDSPLYDAGNKSTIFPSLFIQENI